MLVDSVGRDSLEICGERGCCGVSESGVLSLPVPGMLHTRGGERRRVGWREEGLGGEEGS
jgi:hypothetical protein